MAEYINRASLMGKLTAGEAQTAMREMDGSQAYSFFLNLLNSEPAADVVEVVRCKDCKHFVSPQGRPVCGNFFGLEFPEENGSDFCSYGVRRDNAGGAE